MRGGLRRVAATVAVGGALLAAPGADASSSPGRHLALPLRVSGNAIVDATGRPVVLGGIHRTGYERATGSDLGPVEAGALAHWASLVRIQTDASLLSGGCRTGSRSWLRRLDRAVQTVTSRGMVALVDLHFSATRACGSSSRAALPGADALTFWRTVAARYARNPLVAFELWNEPHDITAAQWRDGGQLGSPAGSYQAVGMQALYDAVVAASSANLIVVDGMGWAQDPLPIVTRMLRYDRRRTVWAMHIYSCPDPRTCDLTDPSKRTMDPTGADIPAWDALAVTDPVLVTETGYPQQSNAAWQASVADWAGRHAVPLGVVGFADDGRWNGSPFALTDSSRSWAPNAAGAPLAAYLRRVDPPG